MVGCSQGQLCSIEMHVSQLEIRIVVDVIEMEEGKDTRIRSSTLQMHQDVGALKVMAQHLCGEPAAPFVEVADNDAPFCGLARK